MRHKINKVEGIRLGEHVVLDVHTAGVFFLGVGITMFILNITSILQLIPYLSAMNKILGPYPLYGFYISLISSIILISYSIFNIYNE